MYLVLLLVALAPHPGTATTDRSYSQRYTSDPLDQELAEWEYWVSRTFSSTAPPYSNVASFFEHDPLYWEEDISTSWQEDSAVLENPWVTQSGVSIGGPPSQATVCHFPVNLSDLEDSDSEDESDVGVETEVSVPLETVSVPPYHGLLVMNATFSDWVTHYDSFSPDEWTQYCETRRRRPMVTQGPQPSEDQHVPTSHEWALSLFAYNFPDTVVELPGGAFEPPSLPGNPGSSRDTEITVTVPASTASGSLLLEPGSHAVSEMSVETDGIALSDVDSDGGSVPTLALWAVEPALPYQGLSVMDATFPEWVAYYNSFSLDQWIEYCVTRRPSRYRRPWTPQECEQYYRALETPAGHEWALSLFAINFPQVHGQTSTLQTQATHAGTEAPPPPSHMGWTALEWTAFYGTFSLLSWASWSAIHSQWTERQWLAYYDSDPKFADPAYWARWVCGLE